MKKVYAVTLFAASLSGCSFFENYNYDDYSLYQYDVNSNPGLGFYEDRDYQEDYYQGSVLQRQMQWSRNRGRIE